MLFKIDENLPVELADLLNRSGHDAKTVNDQNLRGTPDRNLIDVCRLEERAVITLDLDFSDIRTYPPENYSGIIVLRVINQSKPHVLDVMRRVVPLFGRERVNRRLWIVEEDKIRIRGEEIGSGE